MDDTRIPISCHGHAVAALHVLDGQASKEQYRYKSDKCKVIAHNFGQRRPVPLQDGHVQYSQSAVQLGCSVDVLLDGSAHLSAILAKGSHKFPVLLGQMVSMKLPMLALLRAVRVRMIPAVMFGVELVVNVPFFDPLDAWLRATIPRIVSGGSSFLHCMGESHDATCSLAGGSQI